MRNIILKVIRIGQYFLMVISVYFSLWLRFNGDIPANYCSIFLYSVWFIALGKIIVFFLFKVYKIIIKFIHTYDVITIFKANIISTIFFSIIILILAIKVYFKATLKIDEMEELRNKNMAVSVMMSMVVLGIALFVRPSLSRFIASLVHYERFEMIGTQPEDEIQDKKKEGEMIVPMKKIEPKER